MATIKAEYEGCINAKDISDDPMWTIIIDGPGQRIKAGAWNTGKPGCEPTTHHQRHLDIDGGTATLRNPEPGSLFIIEYDYTQDNCGRTQVDVFDVLAGRMYGLVINYGVQCGKPLPIIPPIKPPKPGTTPKPDEPIIIPPDNPTIPGIDVPTQPPDVDLPTPIPEPTTMFLLGSAILGAAIHRRMKGK